MTATRIARAGRSRFFIGLGVLVITMGFVAMFHSSQQQLDESRRMEIRCEQEQDLLSSQIEGLESKLKLERQEHKQFKHNLEREAREQTDLKEKVVQESNSKLESLQQHYKLLKSQHDDYTEECSKVKAKQLEEINALQRKVKSLQSQNSQSVKEKDKDIELWKTKYNQLLSEKQLLEKSSGKLDSTGIHRLKQQISEFESHCSWRPQQTIVGPTPAISSSAAISRSTKPSIGKNFNAQIALVPKPLEAAAALSQSSTSTTAATNRKTSESNGDLKLNVAPNAPMPQVQSRQVPSSTTAASKKADEVKQLKHPKPLPNGVVPFQNDLDENSGGKTMDKNDADQSKPQENNRYMNVVDEANENGKKETDPLKELQNDDQHDTGAREVNDNDDFVIHDHNHQNHIQNSLTDHKNGVINNAAEEDMNFYENKFKLPQLGKENVADIPNNDDDLQVVHRGDDGDDDNRLPLNGKQLKNEVSDDQGKAYPDDVHLEEQMENDEDDDEYVDHANRKAQDPAIRNRR